MTLWCVFWNLTAAVIYFFKLNRSNTSSTAVTEQAWPFTSPVVVRVSKRAGTRDCRSNMTWLHNQTIYGISECVFLTYINGAAHEGASLQTFLHDLIQLFGCLLHFIKFSNTSSEVFHSLSSVPTLKSLIGTMKPERQYTNYNCQKFCCQVLVLLSLLYRLMQLTCIGLDSKRC